jgi:hypothetical protein
MKKASSIIAPFLALAIILAIIATHPRPETQPFVAPINPLIGDISYIHTHGTAPVATTDEDLRIRTHLAFVEAQLRKMPTPTLTPEMRSKREAILDHLHAYWTAGIFPRNYDHQGSRKPCFIDRDGRICAVGYLVEQTAGREAAEAINQKHQYERLLAMNDSALDEWIAGSGLSKTECAMIQPMYGWPTPTPPSANHITRASAISSSGFIGLNASMAGLNGLQILKGAKGRALPIIGLVSGAGQIALGIATMPEPVFDEDYQTYINNDSQRQLSMVNIGVGTASMALSLVNFFHNRPAVRPKFSWNVQGQGNGMTLGFTRTF